jgi:superfamily II DNA or RNA helicase
MVRLVLTSDNKWLAMTHYDEEFEKKQLDISLTKKIKNHHFHPLVKRKVWDGAISFINKHSPVWKIPVGLWSEVLKVSSKYKLDVQIEGLERVIDEDLKQEDVQKWCDEFFKDKEFKPREYQVESAFKIIKFRLSTSEIATSSGKTLISFIVFGFLRQVKGVKKFLMIVPNTNLVLQGTDDFLEYGLKDLDPELEIQQIHGENKKKKTGALMIGTYQSLVKMEDDFFEDVEAVFVDEAHSAPTTSIKSILAKCKDSIWRFGLSGTLPGASTAEYMTAQHLLGPLVMEITPDFLFKNKFATPVFVKIVKMDWVEDNVKKNLHHLRRTKNHTEDLEGSDILVLEKKIVTSSDKRLNFVTDFINKVSKNSLVLFHSVGDGYGRRIYDRLRELDASKEVFYIDGNTDIENREYYISQMEIGVNKILVASFGTLSTGISIKNIHNIFLTESYKSDILIGQTIGRGMRKLEGKEVVNIIDFVDDFSVNDQYAPLNYLMKHSLERIRIYKEKKFNYKLFDVSF